MMKLALKFHDTYCNLTFWDTSDMIKGSNRGDCLTDIMHVSERYYGPLFYEYMEKVMSENA